MTRSPQELAQTVTDAVSELVWAGRLVWADRVVGDQASCVVCGTFWPHHEEGCFAGELENNVKALAEAGERAREALRFCPACGHEWSRHDPEDGMCDAHSDEDGVFGPCRCGREVAFTQDANIRLSRAALGDES